MVNVEMLRHTVWSVCTMVRRNFLSLPTGVYFSLIFCFKSAIGPRVGAALSLTRLCAGWSSVIRIATSCGLDGHGFESR